MRAGVAARSPSSTCPFQLRVLFRILCSRATAPPLSAPPLSDRPQRAPRSPSQRARFNPWRSPPSRAAPPPRPRPRARVTPVLGRRSLPAHTGSLPAGSRGFPWPRDLRASAGFSVFPFAISRHRWGRITAQVGPNEQACGPGISLFVLFVLFVLVVCLFLMCSWDLGVGVWGYEELGAWEVGSLGV